ncbi:hypothetical protein [Peribacillus simplex]|uniref:Uncharacterized protein n=1 Tax=Peribacillus simplex TaxID=1478 RepID=A0AAN2PB47_9BACI|nr:hypothetical protein [Peribacillus simplex]CEG24551.1 hypothetical protein BN1180_05366 [Peribacillus simplex]
MSEIVILLEIATYFGGPLLVIIGLYKLFFQKYIANVLSQMHQHTNNKLLEEIKHNNQKIVEQIKADYNVQIEEIKKVHSKEIEEHKTTLLNVARYSEYQFKLYNELWASLYDLKSASEDLWEHANNKNLLTFVNHLSECNVKVGRNILLLDDKHYVRLKNIIDTFAKYQVGKTKLINVKNNSLDNYRIQLIINDNELIKENFAELLDELAVVFKNHISHSPSAGTISSFAIRRSNIPY